MRNLLFLALAGTVFAQEPLSLPQAAKLALRENKAIAAAAANVEAAQSRISQARSGLLPKVNYSESFTRGDNPVYVFGSLLTQHQFGAANFAIDSLNQPDAINNFQSQLVVDQPIYDARLTRTAVRSAELAHQMTAEERRRVEMQTVAGVARAYLGAVLAAESLKTAEQAYRSAQADLDRAAAVRAAGMSTDVDVLSIRVHLAAVDEQRIRRAADLQVAKAALNQALGLPLDAPHELATGLARWDAAKSSLSSMESAAPASRAELRQVRLAKDLAETQAKAARASLLPQVGFRAVVEADRQRFVTRAGANWLVGVSLKWNLFNGLADKARIVEADQAARRAALDEQHAGTAVQLQVRRAFADLEAADKRIEVAGAAVAMAEESLRITQNRYAAGLATVTDLLRTETALLDSRTRHLAAIHDQRIAAVELDLAAGRLSADSEVLQ